MLNTITINGAADGPHLLITGGVHGDEFTPMAAVRELSQQVNPAGLCGRLTLVPIVNEAAFLNGHRTADDGLDLARVCPGRADGSVTERTAHALSELIRSADYYIDLHTGSTTDAVYPLAGYTLHPDAAVLERQREMARAFNLPVIWGTSPTLNGRSLSVARDAGVPAIYTEYLGSGVCDPDGVRAYVQGCRNVMGLLGMIEQTAPDSAVEHFVEDSRPNSGHMQIQNPAPQTGFFEPSVTLGEAIQAGRPIGVVTDVSGNSSIEVPSNQNGIVLTLRTFSRVLQGDSLGVILEIQTGETSEAGRAFKNDS
ncbi:MAG: succinylglutamate desuccinylase [Planctomycetota bacterium]|nr:MAG: succinylglutamate desuccinylase [Planctomycetota bacterium]REJ92918.1 MAG: succinylglutamate desuccinylase [Planctomycetota bacterium]REK26153.1 MAG: succinylglutamate desuccinylase [Planctomycetota bacterium]REK33522.1 MAG: succinylglutamate desuccinylase [Planctomycetota bacterium]